MSTFGSNKTDWSVGFNGAGRSPVIPELCCRISYVWVCDTGNCSWSIFRAMWKQDWLSFFIWGFLVGTISCGFLRLFSMKKKKKTNPSWNLNLEEKKVKGAVCSYVVHSAALSQSCPYRSWQILGCHRRLPGLESLYFMLQPLAESHSPTWSASSLYWT